MSLPTAKEDLDLAFRNAGESITSRSPTVVTCLLGTSTPTTAILSGMAEIRTLDAPRARAKSSLQRPSPYSAGHPEPARSHTGSPKAPGSHCRFWHQYGSSAAPPPSDGNCPAFPWCCRSGCFCWPAAAPPAGIDIPAFPPWRFLQSPAPPPGGFLGLLPGDYRAPPGSSGSGAASSATGENSTGSAIFSVCIVSGFCFGLRGWGAPSTGRSISASWRFFRACST